MFPGKLFSSVFFFCEKHVRNDKTSKDLPKSPPESLPEYSKRDVRKTSQKSISRACRPFPNKNPFRPRTVCDTLASSDTWSNLCIIIYSIWRVNQKCKTFSMYSIINCICVIKERSSCIYGTAQCSFLYVRKNGNAKDLTLSIELASHQSSLVLWQCHSSAFYVTQTFLHRFIWHAV